MYCFVFRQDEIKSGLQTMFLKQIEIVLKEAQFPIFSTLRSHVVFLTNGVDEVTIYLSNRQILLCSQNDFEEGCILTDLLVDQMLNLLGPLYTKIEQ
ncbi:MAG: hypothetical protein WBV93_14110 [Anaerobacillus sp.]